MIWLSQLGNWIRMIECIWTYHWRSLHVFQLAFFNQYARYLKTKDETMQHCETPLFVLYSGHEKLEWLSLQRPSTPQSRTKC